MSVITKENYFLKSDQTNGEVLFKITDDDKLTVSLVNIAITSKMQTIGFTAGANIAFNSDPSFMYDCINIYLTPIKPESTFHKRIPGFNSAAPDVIGKVTSASKYRIEIKFTEIDTHIMEFIKRYIRSLVPETRLIKLPGNYKMDEYLVYDIPEHNDSPAKYGLRVLLNIK